MIIKRFANFLSEDLPFTAQAPHGVMPSSDDMILLQRKLHAIDNKHMSINSGGCGAFAVILYDAILAEFGVTPEIMAETWSGNDSAHEVSKFKTLDELHKKHMHLHHIVLILDGWVIDSEGIRSRRSEWNEEDQDTHLLDIDQLRGWVEDANGWNEKFPRGQLPKIKEEVEHALRMVGKQVVKKHITEEKIKKAAEKAIAEADKPKKHRKK